MALLYLDYTCLTVASQVCSKVLQAARGIHTIVQHPLSQPDFPFQCGKADNLTSSCTMVGLRAIAACFSFPDMTWQALLHKDTEAQLYIKAALD